MKKVVLFFVMGIIFASCSNETVKNEDTNADSTKQVKVVTPAFDSAKVYPFMEVKKLYDKNWEGEEAGNAALDGQAVTITGTINSKGEIMEMVGNDFKVKGARIQFRGSEFSNPDSGHDVECLFSVDKAPQVKALEDGSTVTVRGTIKQQEWYIESADFKYTVLTLDNCELLTK